MYGTLETFLANKFKFGMCKIEPAPRFQGSAGALGADLGSKYSRRGV